METLSGVQLWIYLVVLEIGHGVVGLVSAGDPWLLGLGDTLLFSLPVILGMRFFSLLIPWGTNPSRSSLAHLSTAEKTQATQVTLRV